MKHLTRAHLGLAATLIIIAVLVSLPLPFYTHQWHKLMHIIGAILFIGNIIIAAAWMTLAMFTRQVKVLHFAAKGVNMADILFTIPGVLLLFINGLVMAPVFGGGNVLGASWVVAALALFIVSGVVWGGFLLRYQFQLVDLSATGDTVSPEFNRALMKWTGWGILATILPIISLVIMVFKPSF